MHAKYLQESRLQLGQEGLELSTDLDDKAAESLQNSGLDLLYTMRRIELVSQ